MLDLDREPTPIQWKPNTISRLLSSMRKQTNKVCYYIYSPPSVGTSPPVLPLLRSELHDTML